MLTSSLAGFDDPAHLGCGVAFEDRRTGDEDPGARFYHEGRGLDRDTAVDLDGDAGHHLEAPDLLDHLGDEVLAPEAGVDAHDVHVVHVGQGPLDRLGRGRRIQGHAGLAASGVDQIQRPVQVGDDLGLHGDADDPGLDESWDQVVGVRHLKVGVYGEVDRGGERGRDGGSYGQVGHEMVVHDVEVYEAGAPPLGP